MSLPAVLSRRVVPAVALALGLSFSGASFAQEAAGGAAGGEHAQQAGSHETPNPPRQSWSFGGPLGKYDPAQLQRGFKIYKEVCSNCHSLSLISFRNLAEPGGLGFTEAQVKTLLQDYKVQDGPNDSGDMFERPARLSDTFPLTFPNEQAARAANGGAYPPDMSLLAKARSFERGFPAFLWDAVAQYEEQGPDYIHGILTGYKEPPEGVKAPREGLNYNEYFPNHWLGMAQPIQDGQVEYTDGTPTTVDQYGKDVGSFLMWAAEPHLAARKSTGMVVMIFLLIFGSLVFFTKKKIWRDLH